MSSVLELQKNVSYRLIAWQQQSGQRMCVSNEKKLAKARRMRNSTKNSKITWTGSLLKAHKGGDKRIESIGEHSVRYPWSVISDGAWYRKSDIGLNSTESDIISDIGIKFFLISDIQLFYL
jgi:hypothetical protein